MYNMLKKVNLKSYSIRSLLAPRFLSILKPTYLSYLKTTPPATLKPPGLSKQQYIPVKSMSFCCKGGCMIGPSILNADLSRLAEECQRMLDAGADYLHLDVMDGHFVPNLTFGAPVIQSLRSKFPGVIFEVHMMVSNPAQWVGDMAEAGADIYTFHLEATNNPKQVIESIRNSGMKAGCGIKPNTDVNQLADLAPLLDVLLIMTVEPGFGGQSFMSDMMPKVRSLRAAYPDSNIEVDGGLSLKTIETAAQAGANMIVSGSAVVKSDNPAHVIKSLKDTVNKFTTEIDS